LKEGEVISIDDVRRYLSSEILAETPAIDLPIVLEKEDYLIINKPK
jgi:23S rRNA-/tRNA-specific pseudouridylate synthase